MALLSTLPDLQSIVASTGGDDLIEAFSNASSYPYRFDSAYVGSKDRQSNFGMYGDPTITLTPSGSLNWAYNETTTKTFTVQCNHSTWSFHTDSVVTGFTVAVYNWSNTTKIGDYDTSTDWSSDVTIRVTPNAQNSGSTDKYCSIYCGTYNDYLITGGFADYVQEHQVIQPTVSFQSSDSTVTIGSTSYYIVIADNEITISFTPSGMASSPCTLYFDVTIPGPTNVGSTTRANCQNGVAINSFVIPLTYPNVVLENTNYLVDIRDNNA